MFERSKLFVIESSKAQQQKIKTIFEFINQPICLMTAGDEQTVHNDGFAVFVYSHELKDEDLSQIENLLAQDPILPVLINSKNTKLINQLKRNEPSRKIVPIDVPLCCNTLQEGIKQCRIFYHQHLPDNEEVNLYKSLVGSSRAIKMVRHLIEQVSDTDANVLILGESGTGKELTAQSIHEHSIRAKRPFIPINCGAIPAELLESELFGHEKGAFTGAISTRKGRFELANGGTLFLDEIGDMPLNMQVKLLRVLQERTFERVGSNQSIEVDVRIIAATHRNLENEIEKGTFREDLFYRLNVFPIEIPPLRQRVEDIPLLINELVTRLENAGRPTAKLMLDAIQGLCQYQWPGNIRELANMVERLSILYPHGVVNYQSLPSRYRSPQSANQAVMPSETIQLSASNQECIEQSVMPTTLELEGSGLDLKAHLMKTEISLITQALDECDWVVARAATFLKMRRTTLVEKMRKYSLVRPEKA